MASRQVYVNDLVTVDIMAKRWKMSVGQVTNIVKGRDGRKTYHFPEPIAGWGCRGVWLWPDVDEWYQRVRPDQPAAYRKAAKQAKKNKYRNDTNHVRAA